MNAHTCNLEDSESIDLFTAYRSPSIFISNKMERLDEPHRASKPLSGGFTPEEPRRWFLLVAETQALIIHTA